MSLTESVEKILQNHKNSENNQEKTLKQDLKNLVCIDSIRLRTVGDLLKESFVVPDYQRGYKWTDIQVEQLLDDIDKHQEKQGFYCLQPIVATGSEKRELIDGQQRITTIYLILSYLNSHSNDDSDTKHFKSLEYNTRKESREFLENLDWGNISLSEDDNIDIHHFKKACQTIENWFEQDKDKKEWERKLLKKCQVIWYEASIQEGETSESVFRRLNSGKIQLTNAELIKALFLTHIDSSQRIEDQNLSKGMMAREWDNIEQDLQNNDFWCFINGGISKGKATRIDLIFELCTGKKPTPNDARAVFRHYANELSEKDKNTQFSQITEWWGEIKRCHYRLKSWHEEDDLYHDIGFLLVRDIEPLDSLLENSKALNKSEFKGEIKKTIHAKFSKFLDPESKDVDSLQYGENNMEIQSILYLFNIHEHKKENTRFPFLQYEAVKNTGGWSLEHIHATHSQDLPLEDLKVVLLSDIKTLNGHPDINEITKTDLDNWSKELPDIENAEKNKDNLEQIRDDIAALITEYIGEFGGNDLHNMALLSRNHNSKLNASHFPSKRKKIRELEKNGPHELIPLATKRVFAKYYGGSEDNMLRWGAQERETYLEAIKNCIEAYAPTLEEDTN